MKRIFILAHDQARQRAAEFCLREAPAGWVAQFSEPTRTLEQNAMLWKLLTKLADQVVWYGVKLSADDWKDLLTASLRKQRSAPGLDGGFVVFGERTRTYSKAEFSELIELIYAFGAQHGVAFEKREGAPV